jgi:hypothetical protein
MSLSALRFFLLVFILLSVIPRAFADNEIAYRFTDTDPDDDEDDEYFDAYGNRIYDYEYRDKHEKQSKKMQAEASKPFGLAGEEFGKSWNTKNSAPKDEAPAGEEPAPEKPKLLTVSPAPSISVSPSPKPRVLVS